MPVTDITFDIADTQFPLSQSVLAQLAPAGAGVLLAQIESVTPTYVLTADALGGGVFGYSDGGAPGFYPAGGSITPASFNGNAIGLLIVEEVGPPPYNIIFVLLANLLITEFTTLTINGVDFLSATAGFSSGGGTAEWGWTEATAPFTIPGVYNVTIV